MHTCVNNACTLHVLCLTPRGCQKDATYVMDTDVCQGDGFLFILIVCKYPGGEDWTAHTQGLMSQHAGLPDLNLG